MWTNYARVIKTILVVDYSVFACVVVVSSFRGTHDFDPCDSFVVKVTKSEGYLSDAVFLFGVAPSLVVRSSGVRASFFSITHVLESAHCAVIVEVDVPVGEHEVA